LTIERYWNGLRDWHEPEFLGEEAVQERIWNSPYHQNAFVGQQQLWYRGLFMGTEAVSLNTVLEYVEKLDIEDQQYLQEIIHRRLIDAKRMAIVSRAKQAKANVQKNKSRSGTAKDLLADLNG
jgi:hypothetical protein